MRYIFVYFALLAESWHIFRVGECFERAKVREKRYLVYPPPGVNNSPTKVQLILGLGLPMEGGLIVGYVMKSNYNLPYNATFFSNPYVRYQRSAYSNDFPETGTYANLQGSISRWETYKMFESAFNIFGSGKSCLLRAICEAAREPFNDNHGLLGELLHVFLTFYSPLDGLTVILDYVANVGKSIFSHADIANRMIQPVHFNEDELVLRKPSTTAEEFFESADQEYYAAESLGRRSANECRKFATECETSPLEYFTESGE